MAEIHWFPGHMKKALDELTLKLKLVDVVVELVDARAPISSINDDLEKLISNKNRVLVLNKADLADLEVTNKLVNHLKKDFDDVLTLSLNDKNAKKIITSVISKLGKAKHDKDIAKGMKPQPLRVAIVGVPNVGKSSLINCLVGRKVASVENKPGHTRGEQWVKINNDFLLLDTPGILPMNYSDRTKAINVALIGSIKEIILPNTDLIEVLLPFLKENYPNILKDRFEIDEISDYTNTLSQIAKRRGLFLKDGEFDLLKAEALLLKELKDGLLGRVSYDRI